MQNVCKYQRTSISINGHSDVILYVPKSINIPHSIELLKALIKSAQAPEVSAGQSEIVYADPTQL